MLLLILRYCRDLGANLVAHTTSWQLKAPRVRPGVHATLQSAQPANTDDQNKSRPVNIGYRQHEHYIGCKPQRQKNVPFSGSCGGFSPDRVPAVSLKPDASNSCAS